MTLSAWRGSDTFPARELRHVYRRGGGDLNGFALSRIEQRQLCQLRCTTPEADWQMLWQSPALEAATVMLRALIPLTLTRRTHAPRP